jgi:hypothetical protein
MMDIEKKLSFSFSATTGVNPKVPMMRIEIPIHEPPREKATSGLEASFRGIKGVHRAWFNPTTRRLSLW